MLSAVCALAVQSTCDGGCLVLISLLALCVRHNIESMRIFRYKSLITFQKDRTVISRHINNIFKEGELDESLVCAKFAHTKDYGRREGFSQRKETTLIILM